MRIEEPRRGWNAGAVVREGVKVEVSIARPAIAMFGLWLGEGEGENIDGRVEWARIWR